MNQEKSKVFRRLTILFWCYLLSYALVVYCMFQWNGGAILFFSIFTFGLPLLLLFLPFLGGFMFYRKNIVWIVLLFLPNIVPFFVLSNMLGQFPLQKMVDESPSYETLSLGLSLFIVGSLILYLTIATVSFVCCIRNRKIWQPIEEEENHA